MAPPLTAFTGRLKALLEDLNWGEIREGYEGADVRTGRDYPLCLITPADTPVVSTSMISPAASADTAPVELLELEFWCIVADRGGTAAEAQRKVHEKANDVVRLLRLNARLRLNDEPICMDSQTHLQRRYVPGGETVDAITVRVRVKLVDDPRADGGAGSAVAEPA